MSITLTKVAEPYVEALLDLAESLDSTGSPESFDSTDSPESLDSTSSPESSDSTIEFRIDKDMNLISESLKNSSDLKKMLENPLISKDVKKNFVRDIFGKCIGDLTLKFLFVIIDRGRTDALKTICDNFEEGLNKRKGVVIARVTAADFLSTAQQNSLILLIKRMTNAKQIKFAFRYESSLVSGIIVEVGSIIVDVSLLGKLKEISNLLGVEAPYVGELLL